jgi:hypothetical protein
MSAAALCAAFSQFDQGQSKRKAPEFFGADRKSRCFSGHPLNGEDNSRTSAQCLVRIRLRFDEWQFEAANAGENGFETALPLQKDMYERQEIE